MDEEDPDEDVGGGDNDILFGIAFGNINANGDTDADYLDQVRPRPVRLSFTRLSQPAEPAT